MKITQDDLKKQKKPKGKGGRPPDPKLEEKKRSLNKDYYNLREKEGFTKSKTMDILKKKYFLLQLATKLMDKKSRANQVDT